MPLVLGKDGITYRNTGTFAAPVWDDIPNLTNVTLDMSKSEADVTTRGGNGWKQRVGVLKNGSVDSEMVYDSADLDFIALQSAFFNDTLVELAVMDGDIATTGNQGLRATFSIGNFSRNEELEDAMRVPVSFWVSYGTTPEWYLVP